MFSICLLLVCISPTSRCLYIPAWFPYELCAGFLIVIFAPSGAFMRTDGFVSTSLTGVIRRKQVTGYRLVAARLFSKGLFMSTPAALLAYMESDP